jgi:hypothetical protein
MSRVSAKAAFAHHPLPPPEDTAQLTNYFNMITVRRNIRTELGKITIFSKNSSSCVIVEPSVYFFGFEVFIEQDNGFYSKKKIDEKPTAQEETTLENFEKFVLEVRQKFAKNEYESNLVLSDSQFVRKNF